MFRKFICASLSGAFTTRAVCQASDNNNGGSFFLFSPFFVLFLKVASILRNVARDMYKEVKDWAPIVAALLGGAAFKFSGVTVGPGRAIGLLLRSKLRSRPDPSSVRFSEIETFLKKWKFLPKASYIVVVGSKAIGKSLMIESALARRGGIISSIVSPGEKLKDIVSSVQKSVALCGDFKFIDPQRNANRVLFWWKLFGARPTVILSIKELEQGQMPAEITGAVRTLAELGLRVVVDSSPNSFAPGVLTTLRQVVINVEPLDIDTFRKDPEFLALFNILDQHGLSSLVLQTLGGVPGDLKNLLNAIQSKVSQLYFVFCSLYSHYSI